MAKTISPADINTFGKVSQLSIDSGVTYPYVLIKQPGNLPEDKKIESCLPFIGSAFNETKVTANSRQDHYEHMFENDFLYLLFVEINDNAWKPVASYAIKNYTFVDLLAPQSNTSVIYINSGVVDPKLQNTGIFRGFTKHISTNFSEKADYVSLRTQNPLVFRSLRTVFGDEIKKVGQAIADKLEMKDYDADKMVYLTHVAQGVIKGKELDEAAKKVQQYLSQVEGGDAIIFIAKL